MTNNDDSALRRSDAEALRKMAATVDEMRRRWRDDYQETHVRTGKPLGVPNAVLNQMRALSEHMRATEALLRAVGNGGS